MEKLKIDQEESFLLSDGEYSIDTALALRRRTVHRTDDENLITQREYFIDGKSIDEETAPVVRRIFQMCAQGLGPAAIASALRCDKILKPASYRYQTTGNYGTPTDVNEPYGWNQRTIGLILENEVYLGHTVNCRTRVISYKDKRKVKVPKEGQICIENTHEAIIDQTTWDIVQSIRANKRRPNRLGEVNKYSGLLYCSDCGSSLSLLCKKSKGGRIGFQCSNYRNHSYRNQSGCSICTPHRIK